MKVRTMLAGMLLCGGVALAQEVIREVSWSALKAQNRIEEGLLLSKDKDAGFEYIQVSHDGLKQATITVLTIDNPKIAKSLYAIKGRVRYGGVEGIGYLEMWSVFPDGSRYFTRTLGTTGPMKRLKGSSGWRPFVLPFNLQKSPKRPSRLIVNVALPARGAVALSPLKLLQYEKGQDPLITAGQWWGPRIAGVVGGVVGALVGCLGALVGILCSMGRARRLGELGLHWRCPLPDSDTRGPPAGLVPRHRHVGPRGEGLLQRVHLLRPSSARALG